MYRIVASFELKGILKSHLVQLPATSRDTHISIRCSEPNLPLLHLISASFLVHPGQIFLCIISPKGDGISNAIFSDK